MELIDIVDKLIGNIKPIGDTSVDEERFENLKVYCELINEMVRRVDDVACKNESSTLASVKKANDYIGYFFTNTLGIAE
jgi:hypothetical protein